MISVVMPVFNQERHISRAIESVIAQKFCNLELLIIDDGSSDSSASIVAQFNDPRIRLIHQINQGVSIARNRGIQEAKFDIIAFLDSDDEWDPQYLKKILELSQLYPSCDIFSTKYRLKFANSGTERDARINKLKPGFSDGIVSNYFEICAESDPLIWTSAVAARKQAILDVGGFPPGLTSGEDLITWAKLACKYQIAYSTEVLSTFWFNRGNARKPKRHPDKPDLVAFELNHLMRKHGINALNKYYGWYKKSRAIHAFESGDRLECLKSAAQALPHMSLSLKAFQLVALPFIPRALYFYWKELHAKNTHHRG